MAIAATHIPFNPDFDLTRYLAFRAEQTVYNDFLWTYDVLDHMRMPANAHITELLLYIGLVLKDWLDAVDYQGTVLYQDDFLGIFVDIIAPSSNPDGSEITTNILTQLHVREIVPDEYNFVYVRVSDDNLLNTRTEKWIYTDSPVVSPNTECTMYNPDYPACLSGDPDCPEYIPYAPPGDLAYLLPDPAFRWIDESKVAIVNILYTPAFPDIIYDNQLGGNISVDSPHRKITPTIAYRIVKREPSSMSKSPFGSRHKQWKFRNCGEFKGPIDPVTNIAPIYAVRHRFWESRVEFVCMHNTGAEAEIMCVGFEQFMEMNEGKLLAAGLNKMAPEGRKMEPIVKLEQSGMHYRSTLFWFRTQEFQARGPIVPITGIDMEFYPSSRETITIGK